MGRSASRLTYISCCKPGQAWHVPVFAHGHAATLSSSSVPAAASVATQLLKLTVEVWLQGSDAGTADDISTLRRHAVKVRLPTAISLLAAGSVTGGE
jgi:hypothetical protein